MAIECSHGRLARKCELCELETEIKTLKVERDKAVELLRGICCQCEVHSLTDTRFKCHHCKKVQAFLASIRGEGKNGLAND